MTIERYLAELERKLPLTRRRRFLAEAEEHLRDSMAHHLASGLSPEAAEAAALADFGSVDVVAHRVAVEAAVLETRAASVLALAATTFFVVPLYVVPENTLPPAGWATKPDDISTLQIVTVSLWLAAVALAAVGAVLAWTPWSRRAAAATVAGAVALAGASAASSALVVRWFMAASATPEWPLLAAPMALGCLAACALAGALARRRRGLLEA